MIPPVIPKCQTAVAYIPDILTWSPDFQGNEASLPMEMCSNCEYTTSCMLLLAIMNMNVVDLLMLQVICMCFIMHETFVHQSKINQCVRLER